MVVLGTGRQARFDSLPQMFLERRIMYAIIIDNDDCTETWGPYDSYELAAEVIDAYVMQASSARIVTATEDMDYTGSPL